MAGVRLEVTGRCWNDDNGPYLLVCRRTDVPAGSPPTVYCMELLQTWAVNGSGDPIPVSGRWLHGQDEASLAVEIALGNPMFCRQPIPAPPDAPGRGGDRAGGPSSTRPSDFTAGVRSSPAPSPQAAPADAPVPESQLEPKAPPPGFENDFVVPQAPTAQAAPSTTPSTTTSPPPSQPNTSPQEDYPGHGDYLESREDEYFHKNRLAERKAAAEKAAKEAAERLAEADAAAAAQAAELLAAGPPKSSPPSLPVRDPAASVVREEDVPPRAAAMAAPASPSPAATPLATPKPHAWPATGAFVAAAAPTPPAAPGLQPASGLPVKQTSGLPVKPYPGQKEQRQRLGAIPEDSPDPSTSSGPGTTSSQVQQHETASTPPTLEAQSQSQAEASPTEDQPDDSLKENDPSEEAAPPDASLAEKHPDSSLTKDDQCETVAPPDASPTEDKPDSSLTEDATTTVEPPTPAVAKRPRGPAPLCDGGGVGTVQFLPGTADLWPGPPDPHASPQSPPAAFDIASADSDEDADSQPKDLQSSEVAHELLSQPEEELQRATRAAGVESGARVQQSAPTAPMSQPLLLDLSTALDDSPAPLRQQLIATFIQALVSGAPPSRDIRDNVARHLYIRGQEIPPALADLIRQGREPLLALLDQAASTGSSPLPMSAASPSTTSPATPSPSGRPLWTQGEWVNGVWQWSPEAWEAWQSWETAQK